MRHAGLFLYMSFRSFLGLKGTRVLNPDTAKGHEAGLAVTSADGASWQLLWRSPALPRALIYWMPALGVPVRHYLPLAEALAKRGMAVALHEWRGLGSSDRRAARGQSWGYRELLEKDMPAGVDVARQRWPGLPLWLGGHSLGGQLACLWSGQHVAEVAGLALVASGAPFWRRFPRGPLIALSYLVVPWLARVLGYFPGRRFGFGGNEARGVMCDWARSGLSGRYQPMGITDDLEGGMAQARFPVLNLRLVDDWLVPPGSVDWLLGKMPHAEQVREVMDVRSLGVRADHFAWMKTPEAVAAWLVTRGPG